MGRGPNRDDGGDPLVFQDIRKTGIFVVEHEFVDQRHYDRLIALGRDRGKGVADHRTGNVGSRSGDQGIDDCDALGARLSEQLLDPGNGSDAARSPFGVAELLDEIHHQKRRGLGIDRDGFELGRRRRLHARPLLDDGLGRRGGAVGQGERKRGERQQMA